MTWRRWRLFAPASCFDNGEFSFWQAALRRGEEWDDAPRDYQPYYDWLAARLRPGRWAVIPDRPGAPSQVNDSLLPGWPFGPTYGVPLWHMDGPLQRLGRLCETYDKVALGWIGHPKKEPVGCPRYRERMEEVDRFFGNRWHPTHMMRGVAVAFDYPFDGADSTSLAQNGHRYDSPLETLWGDQWAGRQAYANHLERRRLLSGVSEHRRDAFRRRGAPRLGRAGDIAADQPGLWRRDGDLP
jgi:hypothetical protein